MEDMSGRAYARYFSIAFEKEEIQRERCLHKVEKDLSRQLGGQLRAIISKWTAVILVKVASEGRSRRKRRMTTVLGKNCVVSEYAIYRRKVMIYRVIRPSVDKCLFK